MPAAAAAALISAAVALSALKIAGCCLSIHTRSLRSVTLAMLAPRAAVRPDRGAPGITRGPPR
ncbi:Uncharacterised protein [Nocardia asteroides]|nr:Uncharacterised protein [Nocardia asteroides]